MEEAPELTRAQYAYLDACDRFVTIAHQILGPANCDLAAATVEAAEMARLQVSLWTAFVEFLEVRARGNGSSDTEVRLLVAEYRKALAAARADAAGESNR